MTTDLSRLDVPLPQLEARIRFAARMDRLPWLLKHPEWPTGHATDGESAELRHLLIDADPDATTRQFVDLRKGRKL